MVVNTWFDFLCHQQLMHRY